MRNLYILIIIVIVLIFAGAYYTIYSQLKLYQQEAPSDAYQKPIPNLVLHISNQSKDIDPVDISIKIDDNEVINKQLYYTSNRSNWKEFRINISTGTHTIRAESKIGKTVFEKEITVAGKHWGVLTYGSEQTDTGTSTPKIFIFEFHDKPISLEIRN